MHQQETKSSLHTVNSQGDQSPPKLNTLISISSNNSTTFKRISSPSIENMTNDKNSQKINAYKSKFQQDSDQCHSQVFSKDFIEQSKHNDIPIRKSFTAPFKKTQVPTSQKQEKTQPLVNSNITNDLSFNCVLTYEGKMFETVCNIKMEYVQFFKNGLTIELSKITKMKVRYEQYQKCLQLTYNDIRSNRLCQSKLKIHITNDVKDDLYTLFSKIMIKKLALLSFKINQLEKDDDKIDRFVMNGSILKKSKFIGKWQMRKMIITDHIESFKCDKCTFEIKNIKEIWTSLVVKLRHSLDKTQLAIPITNYCARFCKNNWIYRIYKLISPSLT